MGHVRKKPIAGVAQCLLVAIALILPGVARATTFSLLHSFQTAEDGATPNGQLIFGPDGAMYGTTTNYGGYSSCGTVFKLKRNATARRWKGTVLHHFHGSTGGCSPFTGVLMDSSGTLYGSAVGSGLASCNFGLGCGVVFKLIPPTEGARRWHYKVLYRFAGAPNDGAQPSGIMLHSDGALYVTSGAGGSSDLGGVVRLTPAQEVTRWRATLLHSFTGGAEDGAYPFYRLVAGPDGALFGTSHNGGSSDGGIVFKLMPDVQKPDTWKFVLLHSFPAHKGIPINTPNITVAPDGTLYGTRPDGGRSGGGSVFRLTPPREGRTEWKENELFSFNHKSIGSVPRGGLTVGADGALYGTAAEGGRFNHGVIFKLAPPDENEMRWTETVLHDFTGGDGGHGPTDGLTIGPDGAFYGTTAGGGAGNSGTVFRLVP
jgi:uncharacterized repeat protein (TIGR03803 family)